jgi:hypothetical protein
VGPRDKIKREILEQFNLHVKGRAPDLRNYNARHDGAEGDWLTRQMGLTVNGRNEPDFKGFEMKKESPKTTFGDWGPDTGLFVKTKSKPNPRLSRNDFLQIFGQPSSDTSGRKAGRYSWSGSVFPKVHSINSFGQHLEVDFERNVNALYYYSKDQRKVKSAVVPPDLQKEKLILVQWSAEGLQRRLERKFNTFGWFKCLKDETGRYSQIQFGYPINFPTFIDLVKSGDVFCDCGMYSTNPRPYMTWRANKNIWDSLSEEICD